MSDLNVVAITGNLTRDPSELKTLNNGTSVTGFGLASNGFKEDDVTFVDVDVFGRTAEVVCEHAKKGTKVAISGRLRLQSWEKDGEKRSKLSITANEIKFLGGKKKEDGERGEPSPPKAKGKTKPPTSEAKTGEEDIPF